MAHGSSPRSRSLWIIGTWRDLLLFVATPALILPVFFTAGSRWSAEEIALFVFAFGQLGHNLPGMLRAYGDKALFQQHKVRFIAAPLGLLAISGIAVGWDLHGLILVTAVWGVWHALMQTYGMLRIYDAKVDSFVQTTQRLDQAMCLAWFGLAVLWSPGRMFMLLDLFFKSGGTLQATSIVRPLTILWTTATIVVTTLFLVHLFRSWTSGRRPSPVKLALMGTSFSFFWYTSVVVPNILLGLAMFEVFHDVQYVAIVWIYNRNRVKSGSDVGPFTRFLFRRSGALAGLYLGLIFAYGFLFYLETWATHGRLKETLTTLLATSALLHYYYDGFIWKIREKTTRESLVSVQGTRSSISAISAAITGPIRHSLKWAVFVIPVCWFGIAELRGSAPKIERLQALKEGLPFSAQAHRDLGYHLQLQGDIDAAAKAYRSAIEIDPQSSDAFNNLGLIFQGKGMPDRAIGCYKQSLRIRPSNAEAHNNLGNAYAEAGDIRQSLWHFRKAIELDPEYQQAFNNLAITLAQEGRFVEAETHLRQALKIAPHAPDTHYNLGSVLAQQKKFSLAVRHYRLVLQYDENNREAQEKISFIESLKKRK